MHFYYLMLDKDATWTTKLFFLGLCKERVDPTQLDDFKLSQRLLETYPNLSVNICNQFTENVCLKEILYKC